MDQPISRTRPTLGKPATGRLDTGGYLIVTVLLSAYGVGNAAPDYRAVVIILRRKLIGACSAFFEGLVAGALEHQVGGPPDINLGYHARQNCRLLVDNRLRAYIPGSYRCEMTIAGD
jgi:hypothetical protein